MATKRQAPSDGETRQPSKRSKPYDHQHRPAHHGKKSFKKAHPVNELKSTVRSLRRLLDRNDDLPANVRIEKERALQTAERELREAEKANKRSEMINKWHKIRFFDRQKAERRLKKAKKEEKEFNEKWDDIEWARLRKQIKESEVEVNYAKYFPLDQDYVPLFPAVRGKDGECEQEPEVDVYGYAKRHGDEGMLEIVRKCTDKGLWALEDLREGKLDEEGEPLQVEEEDVARPAKKEKKTQRGRTSKRGASASMEEDEESEDETGGGFFE